MDGKKPICRDENSVDDFFARRECWLYSTIAFGALGM